MEKSKKGNFIFLILFLSNLTGCIPQMENVNSGNVQSNNVNPETLLSKTSTGQQSVAYLNQLRNSGYIVKYQSASDAEIHSVNGHNGGGFNRQGNNITIYINSTLSDNDRAHVLAHELVHIADDFEIDQSLQNYSYISTAAQDFVTNYKKNGIGSYGQNVISYVLGTLFCSESRAYTINQNLSDQGLSTSSFAHGYGLSQFIDQNYIQPFGTSYGSSAEQMKNWCLGRNSMSDIQSELMW